MQIDAEASYGVPLSFCPRCEVTSITYRELGNDGEVIVKCLSCDTLLGIEGEVEEQIAGPALLSALGYQQEEVRPKGGAGGCRTKGGSCGCKTPKTSSAKKKDFQA